MSYQKKEGVLSSLSAADLFGDTKDLDLPSERIAKVLARENCWDKFTRHFVHDLDPYVVVTLCREIPKQSTFLSVGGDRVVKDETRTINLFTHRTLPKMNGGRNCLLNRKDNNVIEKDIDMWRPSQDMYVKIVLWDKDRFSADDLIGMNKMRVTEAFRGTTSDFIVPLEFRRDGHDKFAGEAQIKITWKIVGTKMRVRLEIIAIADIGQVVVGSGSDQGGLLGGNFSTLAALFIYIGVGMWLYSWTDDLSLIDTLYFIFVSFTGLGYGDLVAPRSYLISSIYILFGYHFKILVVSAVVEFISGHLNHHAHQLFEDKDKVDLMEHHDNHKSRREKIKETLEEDIGVLKTILRKTVGSCPFSVWFVLGTFSIGVLVCMLTCAVKERGEQIGRKLKFNEALFFAVDTVSRIGFGDFTPSTPFWRVMTIFYILVCYGATTKMVGDLMDGIRAARTREKRITTLTNAFRTKDDFAYFDADGDGTITCLEFLTKMLTRLKLCSDTDMEIIRHTFHVLDKDGSGEVSLEELSEFWMAVAKGIEADDNTS